MASLIASAGVGEAMLASRRRWSRMSGSCVYWTCTRRAGGPTDAGMADVELPGGRFSLYLVNKDVRGGTRNAYIGRYVFVNGYVATETVLGRDEVVPNARPE